LKIPFWTVDADVIVPSRLFSKGFYAQHLFRKQLDLLLPEYLVEPVAHTLAKQWSHRKVERWILDDDIHPGLEALRPQREAGGYIPWRRPYRDEAAAVLRGAPACGLRAGAPEAADQWDESALALSALRTHSPLRIALEVKRAVGAGKAPRSACDALHQRVGWMARAGGDFVIHSRDTYDTIECAEPWAERRCAKHMRDRRAYDYTYEQLERGETHDPLWNAAQLQMVRYGWMHNVLRMYWGRKFLSGR